MKYFSDPILVIIGVIAFIAALIDVVTTSPDLMKFSDYDLFTKIMCIVMLLSISILVVKNLIIPLFSRKFYEDDN